MRELMAMSGSRSVGAQVNPTIECVVVASRGERHRLGEIRGSSSSPRSTSSERTSEEPPPDSCKAPTGPAESPFKASRVAVPTVPTASTPPARAFKRGRRRARWVLSSVDVTSRPQRHGAFLPAVACGYRRPGVRGRRGVASPGPDVREGCAPLHRSREMSPLLRTGGSVPVSTSRRRGPVSLVCRRVCVSQLNAGGNELIGGAFSSGLEAGTRGACEWSMYNRCSAVAPIARRGRSSASEFSKCANSMRGRCAYRAGDALVCPVGASR